MRAVPIAFALLALLAGVPLAESASEARTVAFATGARDTWVIGRVDASPADWTQTGSGTWELGVQVDVRGVAPDALLALDVWLVRDGQSLFPYNPVLFQGPRTAGATLTALHEAPPDADLLVVVATEATAAPLEVRVTLSPDLPAGGSMTARPLASGAGAVLSAYQDDAAAQATGAPRLHRNVQVTDSRALGSGALGVDHTVSLAASRDASRTQLTYLEAYIGTVAGAGRWTGEGALGSATLADGGSILGTSRTGAATVGVSGPDASAAIELGATFTADAAPTLRLRGSTIPYDLPKAGIEVPRLLWSTNGSKLDPAAGTSSGALLTRELVDLGLP